MLVNFKYPAKSSDTVMVTGDFNNWQCPLSLSYNGDAFYASIYTDTDKTSFKFIVNGEWRISKDFDTEKDIQGNINNVFHGDIEYSNGSQMDFTEDYEVMSSPVESMVNVTRSPSPIKIKYATVEAQDTGVSCWLKQMKNMLRY